MITVEQIAAVQEAHDALLRGCSFQFCDGPDSPPVDMITCTLCRAVYTLRQAFPHITYIPQED